MDDQQLHPKTDDRALTPGSAPRDEATEETVPPVDEPSTDDRAQTSCARLEEQMQRLLTVQRRMMWAVAILAALLVLALGVVFTVGGQAYREVEAACAQVETISATLEDSLGKLDPEALDGLMQTLPDIADRLSKIDVDALNDTLEALPGLMESVERMEQQVDQLASLFSGLSRLFG